MTMRIAASAQRRVLRSRGAARCAPIMTSAMQTWAMTRASAAVSASIGWNPPGSPRRPLAERVMSSRCRPSRTTRALQYASAGSAGPGSGAIDAGAANGGWTLHAWIAGSSQNHSRSACHGNGKTALPRGGRVRLTDFLSSFVDATWLRPPRA